MSNLQSVVSATRDPHCYGEASPQYQRSTPPGAGCEGSPAAPGDSLVS